MKTAEIYGVSDDIISGMNYTIKTRFESAEQQLNRTRDAGVQCMADLVEKNRRVLDNCFI